MSEKDRGESHRSFKLTTLSLRNGTSVFILAFMVIFMGLGAYISMPKELFPDIEIPTVYVSTAYPGNSPADMENLITRPLEKEIESVEGIKEMSSTSKQDFSAIVVEFNTNVDIQGALLDVKDAIDKAKKELPNDLKEDPKAQEVDVSQFPIFNINLSGDFSIRDLKSYADKIQDEIETVPQINEVEIKGDLNREIKVNVNLHEMEANEVSFRDIESGISEENVAIGAGDVKLGKDRRSVRIVGEFERVDDIRDIIVKHEKGKIVYLRDIAEVKDGFEERESYARLDGDPVVSLDVIKKAGRNLLQATDEVNKILEEAKQEFLPENLNITITNDQSDQTRNQINNLENSIISGVILVVLVLYFFLGFRNALFVGLAIPMSMFLSFLILSFLGYSLNLIILFALILALGMLVDNAIVVIENIYRFYHEEGASAFEAAKRGVGEIAIPIISSTATTLAAFFPLLFWDSLVGEFMGYLPVTLIVVLASSLFVALVINPVVAKTFIKENEEKKDLGRFFIVVLAFAGLSALSYAFVSNSLGSILGLAAILTSLNRFLLKPAANWFQEVFLVKLEKVYLVVLKFALKGLRPYFFLFGMVVLLVGAIGYYFGSSPKVEFFPVNQPKYINVFAEVPVGSDITYTDSIAKVLEADLRNLLKEDQAIITSMVANVGKGTSDPGGGPESMAQGKTPNKARITVSFKQYEFRQGKSTGEIMKRISSELVEIPGVQTSVKKNREGPPVGRPINIEISGKDIQKLFHLVGDIREAIRAKNIPGIEGLQMDVERGKPEMLVNIDRDRARSLGLSTQQVGGTMRTALFGKEISKYKEGEDDYPIMLRLQKDFRYDISSLMNQRITFKDQNTGKMVQVPVSAVADYDFTTTYGSIKRKDMNRVITLYSNVIEGYNSTEINNRIEEVLENYEMPQGYEYEFTGKQQEQEESMNFLIQALLIAVALIALILVTQFNSVVKPLIIVISVVFSTIGVFLGLGITQMDFVVIMTGIGIVSLAGIVVNNSIVLIDYIDLKKEEIREDQDMGEGENLSREDRMRAVIEGGKIRLRPVLLTAITTVLGLIPLATGMNIDFYGLLASFEPNIYFGGDNAIFWGPMAWTVIFGLTFATFLTLVMVPVMYLIAERMRLRFGGAK